MQRLPKWQKIFYQHPYAAAGWFPSPCPASRDPLGVSLNGQVVGWVQDREALEDALRELQQEKEADYGEGVELTGNLEFAQVTERDLEAEEAAQLASRLEKLMTYTVPAALITVNGSPVVALAGEEEAQQVLAAVQEEYCSSEEGQSWKRLL